jgi:hypothetical protein
MKVFLLVMATLGSNYGADQIVPTTIQEMPGMQACEAIAKAAMEAARKRIVVRCVLAEKDYE